MRQKDFPTFNGGHGHSITVALRRSTPGSVEAPLRVGAWEDIDYLTPFQQ